MHMTYVIAIGLSSSTGVMGMNVNAFFLSSHVDISVC